MPATQDILNLFLGVKPAGGTSPLGPIPNGAGRPTEDGGLVFADILGLISNPTPNSDGTAMPESADSETGSFPDITNLNSTEKLRGQITPVWMFGRPESEAGQPFTNIDKRASVFGVATAHAGELPDYFGLSDLNSEQDIDATPGSIVRLSDQLRATIASPGLGRQALSLESRTELQSGSFEILSSSVQNGNIDLTLKSQDTAETIRVTLPLEELMQNSLKSSSSIGASANPLIGQRIPIAATSPNSMELSSWFEKLQLSELKVDVAQQTAGTVNPVKLTLTGAANATGAGIEIVLPSTEIKAFRLSQLSSRTVNRNGNTGGHSGDPNEFGVLTATPFVRPAIAVPRMMMTSATAEALPQFTAGMDTPEQAGGTMANDPQIQSSPTLSDQMKATTGQTGQRLEFGAVRFTLPDKIEQILKPGGKSVMLKIHPEHLGPARLNLNWNGDGISARVTVDSPVAQQAIERSLDRLHEQLSQAGIKVDHIGVALSGGQTRGQFANGQPQRPFLAAALSLNRDYRAAEYATAMAASTGVAAQYVGSQGVNIFA